MAVEVTHSCFGPGILAEVVEYWVEVAEWMCEKMTLEVVHDSLAADLLAEAVGDCVVWNIPWVGEMVPEVSWDWLTGHC